MKSYLLEFSLLERDARTLKTFFLIFLACKFISFLYYYHMPHAFYINPLEEEIICDVIDIANGSLIARHTLPKIGKDFETIPEFFVKIKNKYFPSEIWCITGPGPFTLMRVITLSLNGIAFLQRIKLRWSHLFDLLSASDPQRVPIIQANAQEYMIRRSKEDWDELFNIWSLPPLSYIWVQESPIWYNYLQAMITTKQICEFFTHQNDEIRLTPLYIKPPKITIPVWKKI